MVAAGKADDPHARTALRELCRTYWRPLYLFARRQGHPPEDAKDLVQGFFLALLTGNPFAAVSREKGRFRNFLIAAFLHHVNARHRYETAARRGGGAIHLPLEIDTDDGERRFLADPHTAEDPETFYVRGWALAVLSAAMLRLREDYATRGREDVYSALAGTLEGEPAAQHYKELAVALNLSLSGVKMAAARLRERFRAALRQEVATTVVDESEVDEELRYLHAALRKS